MNKKNIAIYGAGYAGLHIFNEFVTSNDINIVCFVDDNQDLKSKKIRNTEIFHPDDFDLKLINLDIDELIISIPSASSESIKRIYDSYHKKISSIKVLPSLKEILYHKPFVNQIKNFDFELLLDRSSKYFDPKDVSSYIKGKSIMITGGGGTIGSELANQCLKYGAKIIIIIDNSELNLYSVYENYSDEENVIPILLNITDKKSLKDIFIKYKPNIIIHAAAYKHVNMIEMNRISGVYNNVIGTKNCIDLSIEYNAEKFILISTDKAVRPTNVMGASKRICELYIQNVDSKNTDVVAVRFGNVLGSSGSVIPKFKKQINLGGPVTVTHPDITRYFMLIPEACELVLQSGSIGKSGEIFILNMGNPVKIVDLAKKLIKLSNNKDNLKIEFSGLNPGEKLYEELIINDSEFSTSHEDITIAKPTKYDIKLLTEDINVLIKCRDDQSLLFNLKKIVKEFNHKLN